jgi:DNA-directed RNA polymerase subunit omega
LTFSSVQAYKPILKNKNKGDVMARVTIEDCLEHVENRFALVHLTASRVRQLLRGSKRRYECKNKDIVTALREIGDGKVQGTVVRAEDSESELKIEIPS